MEISIRYLPDPFTRDNYKNMLVSMGVDRYFFNSLVVSGVTLVFVMAIAILGGYAISRYRFKGKQVTFSLLLVIQMLPGVTILKELRTAQIPPPIQGDVNGFLAFLDFFLDGERSDRIKLWEWEEIGEEAREAVVQLERLIIDLKQWKNQLAQAEKEELLWDV